MLEGEHCTKYFFQLEKKNARAKVMTATKANDGTIIQKTSEILKIQAEYFQKLYSKSGNVHCRLHDVPPNRLSHEQCTQLENDLTLSEIETAMKGMAQRKTPGNSGFQVDFYIVFWQKLKNMLYETFKECIEVGRMTHSQCQGIISLIPKKDRDLLYVKNWHPIILLNTDYKILAKVYANRMKMVLVDLIHKDQTGFLKGRNIKDNLRRILDVIDYTNLHDIPAILISVDFEKAFDKVRYESLYTILAWFNLGPKFISVIKTLFCDFSLATTGRAWLIRTRLIRSST